MDESARYTGLILASAPMLIPEGQTTSLMDTETTDLHSITGTLGTRLPDTHTDTFMQHIKINTWIYLPLAVYSHIQPHVFAQRRR